MNRDLSNYMKYRIAIGQECCCVAVRTGSDVPHPHSAIVDGWPILCKPQNKQIHLVLPSPTNTEAKTLHTLLQLYREVVKVLCTAHNQEAAFIKQYSQYIVNLVNLSVVWDV